ncbi:MAG TPA: ATPase, T2SS/T4P/T4SS family, partial [Verrucomicrobiae bacterium]|nr:ATPase, T2SS/T4P/T4SS family [Verrucomicrobiae bacterium]
MNGEIRDLGGVRRRSALTRALGGGIAEALAEPDVVEIIVNADGWVWRDRVGEGLGRTQFQLSAFEREAAIRLIAREAGRIVGEANPALSAVLPESGARVQALLPPLSSAPILNIRKRPTRVFTLDDYVKAGAANAAQAATLKRAVVDRRNIVVAGGTGSGKTTLLNALLAEEAFAAA